MQGWKLKLQLLLVICGVIPKIALYAKYVLYMMLTISTNRILTVAVYQHIDYRVLTISYSNC